MKIVKIKEDYYLSLADLRKMYDVYPEKGCVVYVPWVYDSWPTNPEDFVTEKFYMPGQYGFSSVSPFASFVGMRGVIDSNIYVNMKDVAKAIHHSINPIEPEREIKSMKF